MNTYRITYRTVAGAFRTIRRTGNTPESALQSFAQWQLEQGAAAQDLREAPVVQWESSVM